MRASANKIHTIEPEDLRVILWDIDGTLLRSRRVGAFKDYTAPVLESVYGTPGGFMKCLFRG